MLTFEQVSSELDNLKDRVDRLHELLTYEEVLVDKGLFLKYQRELNFIEPITEAYREYLGLKLSRGEIESYKATNPSDGDFDRELTDIVNKIGVLENKLVYMYTSLDGEIETSVIELSSSTGSVLKGVILDIYRAFASANGLDFNITSDGLIEIYGYNAYELLKSENGAHALSDGSDKVMVSVYLITTKVLGFDTKDIDIETTRSSGAGGQHINTTDSAIKATHRPTGITAIAREERSQFQNREKALERLKEKVFDYYESLRIKEIDDKRKQNRKVIRNKPIKTYDLDKGVVCKLDREYLLTDLKLGKIL